MGRTAFSDILLLQVFYVSSEGNILLRGVVVASSYPNSEEPPLEMSRHLVNIIEKCPLFSRLASLP